MEGEAGSEPLPDFSMFSARQMKFLGEEIVLGLAVSLMDRGRLDESRHLLSLCAAGESDIIRSYGEKLTALLDPGFAGNRTSLSTIGGKTEISLIEEKMLEAAVASVRQRGSEGFYEFLRLFLLFPAGKVHREAMYALYQMDYSLDDFSREERELVSGKLLLLDEDYTASEQLLKNALINGFGNEPGIAEDFTLIYRRTGKLKSGAEFLVSASGKEDVHLLLSAGRLFRWAGMYTRGFEVLKEALPHADEKNRAANFMVPP